MVPLTEPKDPESAVDDDALTDEELIKKYHLSHEQIAELRDRLSAEWTPKLLGKKWVKRGQGDSNISSVYIYPVEAATSKGWMTSRRSLGLDVAKTVTRLKVRL
ncbi:MAG: hypothetical protein Q9172_005386 [Xanthocarpia lactea]